MKTINDLYPYQRAGVEFLLEKPSEISGKPHRLLAWDMGTGKTPVSLIALEQFAVKSPAKHNVLIICPATIKETWKRQVLMWTSCHKLNVQIINSGIDYIQPAHSIIIVNYELLLNPAIYKQLLKRKYDVIILDEAHRLKTLNSKRSNLILGRKGANLIARANYKWLLSGSIMPNRPIELFPILKTLAPETIRPYDTWEKFGRYFCNGFKEKFGDYNFKGASHIDELKDRLKPFMSVVKLEDVCNELPDVIESTVFIDVGDIGADNSDTALPTLRRLVGEAKVPKIIEYLEDWLENNEGKLVVFTYHREVTEAINRKFPKLASLIYGGTSSKDKELAVQWFINTPTRLLIAQITTAGEGIDGLQHVCNNIVFAELDWSAGGHDQAIGRLHRIGQTKPVYVTKLVAENTLDENIVATVQNKQKVIERLFKPLLPMDNIPKDWLPDPNIYQRTHNSKGEELWFGGPLTVKQADKIIFEAATTQTHKEKKQIFNCDGEKPEELLFNFEPLIKKTWEIIQKRQEKKQMTIEQNLERIAIALEKQIEMLNGTLEDKKHMPHITDHIRPTLKKEEPDGDEVELESLPKEKPPLVKKQGRQVTTKIVEPLQGSVKVTKLIKVTLDDIKDLCRQYIVSAPSEAEQADKRSDIKEIVERQGVASLNDLGEDHYEEVHTLIKELVDSLPQDLGV